MALDSISNQVTNSPTLFKPVPMNKLQQNLSQHYQKTSSFVDEHFKEMSDAEGVGGSQRRIASAMDDEDMGPRLNPQGMGRYVDIFV